MKQIKSLAEMNYYEILNLSPSCSQQEIDRAYVVGKLAFEENSLAHYGLVENDEREYLLDRIEEAYKTLGNPKKRKRYDLKFLGYKAEAFDKGYFRNGTEKMIIESDEPKPKPKKKKKWWRIIIRR